MPTSSLERALLPMSIGFAIVIALILTWAGWLVLSPDRYILFTYLDAVAARAPPDLQYIARRVLGIAAAAGPIFLILFVALGVLKAYSRYRAASVTPQMSVDGYEAGIRSASANARTIFDEQLADAKANGATDAEIDSLREAFESSLAASLGASEKKLAFYREDPQRLERDMHDLKESLRRGERGRTLPPGDPSSPT